MKKLVISLFITLISTIIVCTAVLSWGYKHLAIEIQQLNNEIELLQEKENKEYFYTHVTNSLWEQISDDSYVGTLYFDDLSQVVKITISYTDWALYELKVADSSYMIDPASNSITVDFTKAHYEYEIHWLSDVQFCKLVVSYLDGREETIFTKIALG